jgi:hypothetical protein
VKRREYVQAVGVVSASGLILACDPKADTLTKVMKTVVAFGNAFGATHLVDLGGAPHSSVFNAPPIRLPQWRLPSSKRSSSI